MTGGSQTDGSREDRRIEVVTIGTQTEDIRQDRGGDLITVGEQTKKGFSRLEARCSERLLPGIPDEVTLDEIVTKLPWRAIDVLRSVSRCWERSIRNHEVYDARVRSQTTETFVVLKCMVSSVSALIALYSMRDKTFVLLPPIPHLRVGVPWGAQCVSLDGKVYVLGGLNEHRSTLCSAEVYVLDLAGGRQWNKCASMRHRRGGFGCGAMDGKIYVFGGICSSEPVCGSEVYDPNEDSWSPIMPMKSMRIHHQVATVGDDFFLVYGGRFYSPGYFEGGIFIGKFDADSVENYILPDTSEIYCPASDRWKLFPCEKTPFLMFMALGKLHRITHLGIDVRDSFHKVWRSLHIHSFTPAIETFARVYALAILAVNDELLLIASSSASEMDGLNERSYLFRSKGLGSNNKTILWERVDCYLSFPSFPPPFMCSIQL